MAGGLLRWILGRRLPRHAGRIAVGGLHGRVVVRRDVDGIPHVEADDDHDAWFAVGFCQGQDRPFQVDVLRRLAAGRLAELFGPEVVGIDRLVRRIGFARVAATQLAVQDPDVRAWLEAFAEGWTRGALDGPRPHEHVLLRAALEPLSAVDVLGILALQSFLLPSNWDCELARLSIAAADGPGAVAATALRYPDWGMASATPGTAIVPAAGRFARDVAAMVDWSGLGGGSNAWALAGRKTRSGRPLLANDPHLAPNLPAHWYLVHVATPSWQLAGASLAGAPGLPVGHNGFCAWGITAGFVDNTDLYREDDGGEGHRVVDETIVVRGRPSVTERVTITPRGPIVGPALDGECGALSLRATWLDPARLRGFLDLGRVRDFTGFRDRFRDWPAPSLNLIYADVDDCIGWQLVGSVPTRGSAPPPVPPRGDDPGAAWGPTPWPFERLPFVRDPPGGWVASANNQPMASAEGLGADWLDAYRVQRIGEELERRDDWDVTSSMGLQTDVLSLPWAELRPFALRAAADAGLGEVEAVLARWDGRVTADSVAATIFELWLAEVARGIASSAAPRSWAWALGRSPTALVACSTLGLRWVAHLVRWVHVRWLDPALVDPRPRALADAMAGAWAILQAQATAPADRAWGRARPVVLRHPLGRGRVLGAIFNRGPLPVGGDANTVAQAGVSVGAPLGPPAAIPSLRMVVDVGAWDACRVALPGGQSGNPTSPHYDDLLRPWLAGEGVPLRFSRESVAAATRAVLELVPR